ncbi:hypothetical protein [Lyngbya sp. CCY1209]|uniref:hypothetical protein n=1 Tax=Lyngbya sp. CCY1209 TaxID=2886103 RepID=UPI002D1FF294|nr:hypothetical protein [Lyngbya sp. CCY1209]MEB3886916.1 hypothetical protein [Lyngbya sp. CCY1209]
MRAEQLVVESTDADRGRIRKIRRRCRDGDGPDRLGAFEIAPEGGQPGESATAPGVSAGLGSAEPTTNPSEARTTAPPWFFRAHSHAANTTTQQL